jgi:predicted metal-binding membrane protein
VVRVSEATARPRPPLARAQTAFLLIVAAGAWAGTIAVARGMAGMTGTMGLGLAVFVPVWTLMMAAMMLPSVAPAASRYARNAPAPGCARNAVSSRTARTAGLAAGYLAIWAAAGVPAFGLAWLAGWVAGRHPGAAHLLAVAVFAACGVYQLSGPKDRCLTHCRAPFASARRGRWPGDLAGWRGDLAAGARHGAYCLGCCWGLMVILVAVGVMNVAAMAGLAVVVLTEKAFSWGPAAGRAFGVAALGLAVALIWLPWLAPGLHAAPPMMMG